MDEAKWYLRTQDETFGPETQERLVEWARKGRIQPGQEVSDDEIIWRRVEEVPFLDMRFSIDIGDGNPRGPFNKVAAEALLASHRLPPTSKLVEVREPFPEEPKTVEKPQQPELDLGKPVVEEVKPSVEPAPIPSVPQAAKAEVKVVEKIVEVPVEKIVEKEVVKEVRVEVPVEKVVEKVVEKIVVDEARVKELEGLLAEERRHTADLQSRMDAASKTASEAALAATTRETELKAQIQEHVVAESGLNTTIAAKDEELKRLAHDLKDADERLAKSAEQVKGLEDELRRLPQAASEVADIQAAMYGIMTGEAEEIGKLMEIERREFEETSSRYKQRMERLQEHRREVLKRAGSSVDDMTHKALVGRPEDPRTVQLRREFDDFRRQHERTLLDKETQIRELSEELRVRQADNLRQSASEKDISQLREEAQQLREALQRAEKDLLNERQRNENLARQQATRQQTLLARLESLESPSIGTPESMETNQSREARQVKLPSWMRLKH